MVGSLVCVLEGLGDLTRQVRELREALDVLESKKLAFCCMLVEKGGLQKHEIASGEEWKVVSARRAKMKLSKVSKTNYFGVFCSSSFSVLRDDDVETLEDNGKADENIPA